ncbi:MAG: DJ-1/PfpI family protein [Muribaculaceae bacterium]|nr:DJ-1/PfpI family protein [Muribaculaceae bacterium]
MKKTYVFLADGFEEIEALTAVDVLRRGGLDVVTVSITQSQQVTGAHGIQVKADIIYDPVAVTDPAWIVLPGGMPGATNLYEFAPLQGLLRRQACSKDGRIAAICAAPAIVLGQLGMLEGEKATCYPGFETYLKGADYIGEPVVVSGKYVLGNGPANALQWALTVLLEATDNVTTEKVASGMLYYSNIKPDVTNIFG